MRIFKLKGFARFARKEGVTDEMLRNAVQGALSKPDADLGGGVIKQRIARSGGGKSGGYRTIMFLRKGDRAFFAYGFAKNERDNIAPDELEDFKELAKVYFSLTTAGIDKALKAGELQEVPT